MADMIRLICLSISQTLSVALQLKQGTCFIVTFPVTDIFIPPNKTIKFLS